MTGSWMKEEQEGYAAWTGLTDTLSVTVIPALGAKAVSLRNRKTGREWLWRSGKPLGHQGYGSPFGDGDESGWDEMFPGINVCQYPEEPWKNCTVPDHGEVWSLPWSSTCTGGILHCAVNGRKFPYTLEKALSFPAENILRIDYVLSNRSAASPFRFMWAAHPLFQAREGMRLAVPGELGEIEVSYSAENRLGGFGDIQPWPVVPTAGGAVDLSVMEAPEGRFAEKYYFTGRLKTGWAKLSDPATGEEAEFRFPAEQVPYLAVWANYGGYSGHYHVAMEPATGRMDDLAHAVSRKEAAEAAPGGLYRWHLELHIR